MIRIIEIIGNPKETTFMNWFHETPLEVKD